ncbi:MAG: hypothetical protein GC200_10995 [Tepidisphaera sp.]|nr:hypothetical protein [Tepidisphaera sp.]
MNTSDSNPDPRPDRRPDLRPVDEAQLLDWIDGRLSAAEQSRLEQASGRAGLSDRIAQMQAHKQILQSLPEEDAPADLMDRVLAALERDQLVGGGMPRQVEDMVIGRRTPSRLPAFAMAAGVLLLIGGASYIGLVAMRANPATPLAPNRSSIPGPLALNTAPVTPDEKPAPDHASKVNESSGAAIASASPMAKTEASQDARALAPDASTEEPAALAQASPPPQPEDLPLDRAAELASEGRLAIRVVADDTRNLPSLEQAGKTSTKWRLRKDVPASVAAAVLPTGPRADIGPETTYTGPAMASAEFRREAAAGILAPHLGLRAGFEALPSNPSDPMSRVRGTYLVEIPAEATSLQSLKKLFADRLHAGVKFEELPEGMAVSPPATPDTVLWWTMGPDHWSPRASVPVVVQRR